MLKIKMTNGNEAVIEEGDLDKFPDAEVLDETDEENELVQEEGEEE